MLPVVSKAKTTSPLGTLPGSVTFIWAVCVSPGFRVIPVMEAGSTPTPPSAATGTAKMERQTRHTIHAVTMLFIRSPSPSPALEPMGAPALQGIIPPDFRVSPPEAHGNRIESLDGNLAFEIKTTIFLLTI
jgi:hypothetical protein